MNFRLKDYLQTQNFIYQKIILLLVNNRQYGALHKN